MAADNGLYDCLILGKYTQQSHRRWTAAHSRQLALPDYVILQDTAGIQTRLSQTVDCSKWLLIMDCMTIWYSASRHGRQSQTVDCST